MCATYGHAAMVVGKCETACLYSCRVFDSPELWSEWMLAQLTFTSSKPLEESHTFMSAAAMQGNIQARVDIKVRSTSGLLLIKLKVLYRLVPEVPSLLVGEIVDLRGGKKQRRSA